MRYLLVEYNRKTGAVISAKAYNNLKPKWDVGNSHSLTWFGVVTFVGGNPRYLFDTTNTDDYNIYTDSMYQLGLKYYQKKIKLKKYIKTLAQ